MDKSAGNSQQIVDSSGKNMYVYMLLPFQIVSSQNRKLFDEINLEEYSQDNLYSNVKKLEELIAPLSHSKSEIPGDHSKYYGFMRYHYGNMKENRGISSFLLNKDLLRPSSEFESFKIVSEQFKAGATLGESSVLLEDMETITIILNSLAGIGFVVFGLNCLSASDNSAVEEFSKLEFFRNIGWRRKQKLSSGQLRKHSFLFKDHANLTMTMHEFLECYFSNLSEFIRFHQDKPAVLYCSTSLKDGNKSNSELSELSYEIIRVQGRNSGNFFQPITDPAIHRIGRNVVFAALNDGALVLGSAKNSNNSKSLANKFFPAFYFALNQREILLSTMEKIAMLEADKLQRLDAEIFEKLNNMRNRLLVLQLKQIFYSVSHLHEVEQFFNKLQNVFAVEKMLMENEQCVREMFTLLEVRRNSDVQKAYKENADLEEIRSRIINTILGAIGCLGLFSFLKDLWPFIQDSQYAILYKLLSVALPFVVMIWLVWFMSDNKGKHL